jgi:hypothetical protein
VRNVHKEADGSKLTLSVYLPRNCFESLNVPSGTGRRTTLAMFTQTRAAHRRLSCAAGNQYDARRSVEHPGVRHATCMFAYLDFGYCDHPRCHRRNIEFICIYHGRTYTSARGAIARNMCHMYSGGVRMAKWIPFQSPNVNATHHITLYFGYRRPRTHKAKRHHIQIQQGGHECDNWYHSC